MGNPAQLYCQNCKSTQEMPVVKSSWSYEGFPHGTYSMRRYPDIWVFHRVRECMNCTVEGSYWEIDDTIFGELLELKEKKEKIEEIFSRLEGVSLEINMALKEIEGLAQNLK